MFSVLYLKYELMLINKTKLIPVMLKPREQIGLEAKILASASTSWQQVYLEHLALA